MDTFLATRIIETQEFRRRIIGENTEELISSLLRERAVSYLVHKKQDSEMTDWIMISKVRELASRPDYLAYDISISAYLLVLLLKPNKQLTELVKTSIRLNGDLKWSTQLYKAVCNAV